MILQLSLKTLHTKSSKRARYFLKSTFIESLPTHVVRLLRAARQGAYLALEPFDYLWRALNGRRDFPPLRLRRYVGPLRSFEMSGAEFMTYCRLLLELQPDETMLDIGCGCGVMALFLKDYLDSSRARYVGLDIHEPSIKWCQRHISERHAHFDFKRIDVRSEAYNPQGHFAAADFSFPLADQSFDVVLLKSVLTHMRPPEVARYVREVARLLSKNGRCLLTLFLLNEGQEKLAGEGLNKLDFSYGDETWRYLHQHSPESAVAYRESYVLELLNDCGLTLRAPVFYGSWSGRTDGLSFQDLLLVQKQETHDAP